MYKLDMKSLLSAVLFTTTLLTVNGESFQFCVNESISYTEFEETVQVTSPGYPEQYDRTRSCGLALILSTDIPAVLHITQYIPTTADCSLPYAIADSRYSLFPNQYKNCSQKDDLNIYTNVVPILSNEQPSAQLILSVAAGLADEFNLNLTVLPLLTMQPSDSKYKVDAMSTPAAYIASHEGFGEVRYGHNVRNQVTLKNLADVSAVTLHFISFNIGTLASCAGQPYDVLKVFGNEESCPLYDCGDTSNKPPQQILDTSSYNSLLFEFVTDDEIGYDGFLLQYSVTREGAVSSSISTTSTPQPMTFTIPDLFSESSSANPKRQTESTDIHPTLTSTSQPANDTVVAAVGVGAGIAGFIVGVVVTLLTQLLYQRCRGDTSGKTQTDSLEAADEPAPEYMIPTVQLDVLTSTRQDVDTTGVDTADVTHRYSYVDLPIAPLPTTTSSNEYMTLNTTSIAIADAAEEQNINDTHLYDKLQNTEER